MACNSHSEILNQVLSVSKIQIFHHNNINILAARLLMLYTTAMLKQVNVVKIFKNTKASENDALNDNKKHDSAGWCWFSFLQETMLKQTMERN